MDMLSYTLFLVFVLISVSFQKEKDKSNVQESHNLARVTYVIFLWAVCSLVRDVNSMGRMIANKTISIMDFKIFFDFAMNLAFIFAILTKVYLRYIQKHFIIVKV